MSKPIVVVGSINLDLVAKSERMPVPGETIVGKLFNTYSGGKGANQAVAVAKLGYPVTMIGKVGEDIFGSQLVKDLATAGVNTEAIQTVRAASGVAIVVTDNAGQNSIVVVPGANSELLPADLQRHQELLLAAEMVMVQLEIPMATVEYVADFTRRHDIPLILDPAPACLLPASLMNNVTWLTPNEVEMYQLFEGADRTLDAWGIAEQLSARGARNIILKLGARGVLLKKQNQPAVMVPGFEVNAVDTTAAGDAFNGAFAVGLAQGDTAHRSAVFANAVAAISITRPGAQPSMPDRTEVDVFLRQRNL